MDLHPKNSDLYCRSWDLPDIKLGQIMSLHSDILPKEYCEELMKLCSDVEPMPFEQVEAVIDASFGYSWKDVFTSIDKKPLGAASIAQVTGPHLKPVSRWL